MSISVNLIKQAKRSVIVSRGELKEAQEELTRALKEGSFEEWVYAANRLSFAADKVRFAIEEFVAECEGTN